MVPWALLLLLQIVNKEKRVRIIQRSLVRSLNVFIMGWIIMPNECKLQNILRLWKKTDIFYLIDISFRCTLSELIKRLLTYLVNKKFLFAYFCWVGKYISISLKKKIIKYYWGWEHLRKKNSFYLDPLLLNFK